MGGLVGVVRLDGEAVERSLIERFKSGSRGSRSTRVRAEGSWAFSLTPPRYSADSPSEPQPFNLADGSILIIEGRLDDPAGLARTLEGPARRSDVALIAAAHDQFGAAAHERLHGEFSLVRWDEKKRELTLARDALGTRALHYCVDGSRVWFASSLHLLLAIPEIPRDLDELALAGMMARAPSERERTLYRHIRRVPSGGSAHFREGSSREHVYWTLESIPAVRFARDKDYVDMARSLFDRAVANRLPERGGVATMLSGGFDSAAVTATAARLLDDRRLTAITRVAGGPDPYRASFDERGLAALVAARYSNIDWVVADELNLHDRIVQSELESGAMGVFVQGGHATWFEPLERHATAAGARVLLSGGWGNATLSWSGAGLYAEQVWRGDIAGAARELYRRSRRKGERFGKLLRTELLAAIEPRPLRRWRRKRRYHGRGPWQQAAVFAPGFLESVGFEDNADALIHDMRRKIPLSGRERRWTMMQQEPAVDRIAYKRNKLPYEVLDPFRDRSIAEFTLGVPERQFQHDGVERWLARRAFADRLPEPLLAQKWRGVQNGDWYHIASLYREQTAEALEGISRSALASRVLDVAFLKSLLDNWPKDAETAMRSDVEHRDMLGFGLSVGTFLRWYEGSNG